jgi:ribosomal protein S18 acetylase RimI-like enzyme
VARGQEVRRGPERLRVAPFRGDVRIAHVTPVAELPPPTATMVEHTCAVLTQRGFREVVTGALNDRERQGFLAAGFSVREELHLLAADLDDLPPAPSQALRRGRRGDRASALRVDALAFDSFWRLDETGLEEALTATPAARFRVAGRHGAVVGYAVCGRAGRRGYVQRLAVDPAQQGSGLGRALLVDGLRWLRRRGATRAVVNTQVGNERALALYHSLGFRLEPTGLAVLTRPLEDRLAAT